VKCIASVTRIQANLKCEYSACILDNLSMLARAGFTITLINHMSCVILPRLSTFLPLRAGELSNLCPWCVSKSEEVTTYLEIRRQDSFADKPSTTTFALAPRCTAHQMHTRMISAVSGCEILVHTRVAKSKKDNTCIWMSAGNCKNSKENSSGPLL
jgi:hypothetical protein